MAKKHTKPLIILQAYKLFIPQGQSERFQPPTIEFYRSRRRIDQKHKASTSYSHTIARPLRAFFRQ